MAKFSKKTKIAVLTAALVVGASGTAFAYWTQSGGGSGGATTGDTTALVVVNQLNTVTGLYPGGTPVALNGNFDNPNAAAVTVGAVTASVTATSVGGCLPAWYAITGTGVAANPILPAGSAVGSWSGLSVALVNEVATNQNACKTATITITYAVAAGA
jgi:hypothetical protein